MVKTNSENQGFLGDTPDVASIAADIHNIRCSAENLQQLGDRYPAISKNAARVLASLKMIELSLPDSAHDPDPEER